MDDNEMIFDSDDGEPEFEVDYDGVYTNCGDCHDYEGSCRNFEGGCRDFEGGCRDFEGGCHGFEGGDHYKVITRESLLVAQSEDLSKVVDLLNIQTREARTLLIHHRWNVENLFSNIAEKGITPVFLEAGLPPSGRNFDIPVAGNVSQFLRCASCLEEVPSSATTRMDCGHSFCNTCWTQYFIIQIADGQSRRVRCMEYKCRAICDEDKVRELVGHENPESAERYERFLLESFIEDNDKVKWCPSTPHCGNAIQVEEEPYCEIECICGQQFCFNCMAEPHSPCPCHMWASWIQKCERESETVDWLTVRTKSCPKCHKLIEKDGGCNRIRCICGQEFCWQCGRTWRGVGTHSCDGTEAARAQRLDWDRFIRYYLRWKWHTDSLQLEQKLQESIHSLKLEQRQQEYMNSFRLQQRQQESINPEKIAREERRHCQVKDYCWLISTGFQMLFRARRALSSSFAFAYLMFNDTSEEQNVINQHLFEDQQQQLEETVESLSEFLKHVEAPLVHNADDSPVQDIRDLQDIRLQVISFTTLINALCRRMYEVVENDLLGSLQQHVAPYHIAPYN